MSQIQTFAELILRREQFLSDLHDTESQVQETMARLSSMTASPGLQMGAMPTAETAEAQSAQVGEYAESVQEFSDSTALNADATRRYSEYVDEFGDMVQDAQVAANQFQAAVSSLPIGSAGMQWGASSPNWSYLLQQQSNSIVGGLAPTAMPNPWFFQQGQQGNVGGSTGGSFMTRHMGMMLAMYGLHSLSESLTQQGQLDHEYEEPDVLKQAEETKRIMEERNSGLEGFIRRHPSVLSPLAAPFVDDPEEAAQTADQAYQDAKRNAESEKRFQKEIQQQQRDRIEIVRDSQGNTAADRAAADEAMQQSIREAEQLGPSGPDSRLRDQREREAIQLNHDRIDKINREDQYGQSQSDLEVGQYQDSGRTADLERQGLDREAKLQSELDAIDRKIQEARNKRDAQESGTPEFDRANAEYNAAYDAGQKEKAAKQQEFQRDTEREAKESADRVNDIQEQGRINDLRAQGKYFEAAAEERHAAIAKQIRDAQEAADNEHDPVKHKQRQDEADAVKDSLGKKQQADDDEADRQRRMQDERQLSDFLREENAARLSSSRNDYQAETQEFERKWNERIKIIQDSKLDEAEKEKLLAAARNARHAEEDARDDAHNRRTHEEETDTRASELRAAGQGQLADLEEYKQHVAEELQDAGGDTGERRRVLENARAHLQEMAKQASPSREFSDIGQYSDAIQQAALGQQGSALKEIQDFYKGLGQAENAPDQTTSEQAFDATVDKLDQAADAIIKNAQKLLILTDN